ncbi:MAG: FAD-binding oxidoreductase [Candidatus Rokubacteria bacterium]|nr:FAD-binding oxidoreductase [Candidatus Rokubacteria bacterium]
MPRTADVVVVGGGVHGASVTYHLARKGAGRVALLEKKFLASGPTGRSTAVVRRHYAHDYLTVSANRSAEIYRHWNEIVGDECGYSEIGWVQFVGEPDRAVMEKGVARARELGARVRMIALDELNTLIPAMAIDDIGAACYEQHSGCADPALTTSAYAHRARELGARILQDTEVTSIRTAGGGVTGVRTTKGEIDAPVVVVCAGLWANRLTSPLGVEIPIEPRRHQMIVFRRPPEFPTHPAVYDLIQGTYCRPDHGDLTLYGITRYAEVADPDRYNEAADFEEIVKATEAIARRFPVMERGLSRGGYAALYDETPDHQPVLGPVPEVPGLYLDCGWSGHGFKHAPVTGDVISEVILTGRYPDGLDAGEFSVTRFREGRTIRAFAPYSPPKYGA